MKKSYLILATAAMVFASCANDDFTGSTENLQKVESGVIGFAAPSPTNMTRADKTGATAATLLGENYVVEGVKGNGTHSGYAASNVVFDHYNVNYVDGSALSSQSNTTGWEYVNQTKSAWTAVAAQTIKYWDYSQDQYDFVAYSGGEATLVNATANAGEIQASAIDYKKIGGAVKNDGTDAVFTFTGATTDLTKGYIADLVTVEKANYQTTTVTPRFRRMGAKVRIAFYETIPGYSVKNVVFYEDATRSNVATKPTLYAANSVIATGNGTMSVYYPTVKANVGSDADHPTSDLNKAHVVFKEATAGDLSTKLAFTNGLKYGGVESNEKTSVHGTAYLERSSVSATYATDTDKDAAYEFVLPVGSGEALNLHVDYTLVPTDGGEETITVHDAMAVVPALYTDWQPNYAYTYLFKISKDTNGSTNIGDPAGLYPITFDAVVMDDLADGIQETITTVSDPSITTYSKGENPTNASEYASGKNIYVSLENPGVATLTTLNTALYTATVEGGAVQVIDEGSVANALANGSAYVVKTVTVGGDVSSLYKLVDGVFTACGATETAVADVTYYEAKTGAKTVVDANGKALTVLVAEETLSIETEIAAADATDGNAVEGNFAMFTPAAAGTYVFEYNDGAKKHYKVIIVH